MDRQPVIIIGSGLAGYTLAREFRKLDSITPLTILSSDHGEFYSKPMLSTVLAQGKTPDALLMKSAEQMGAELQAEIRARSQVSSIDPLQKEIQVNGEILHYRNLVLALGADPIRLPLKGNGAHTVLSVNNLDDYHKFWVAVQGKKRVTILGAGLIGCEFANDLASAGHEVNVVDLAPQVLGRLLPPVAAKFMQQRLEGLGIAFHLSASVKSVEKNEADLSVSLDNGTILDTDVVLSAVGLKPRTVLAAASGIAVNRGIIVDAQMQTSSAGIYALGDCVEVEGRLLPFVMPLMHAARALAQTLNGLPVAVDYPVMPISVKTPACPAVIATRDQANQGQWKIDDQGEGIHALLESEEGDLMGFALLGSSVNDKQALTQQINKIF